LHSDMHMMYKYENTDRGPARRSLGEGGFAVRGLAGSDSIRV